jgi:integrase
MASIFYSEKDKRWVGRIQLPRDPLTGKKPKPKVINVRVKIEGKWTERKWKQAIEKARKKCEEKVMEYEMKIAEGLIGKDMTVATWLRKYLEVYCDDVEVTTREGYTRYIENHIIPFLGELKVAEVRPIHIQNFYNHERKAPRYRTKIKDGKTVPILDKDGNPIPLMKNGKPVIGYSEKTILQMHRILSRAFDKAKADGLTKKNPCKGVDTPSSEEYEPDVYTEDEFLLLLDKLEGHRMEAIVLLAGMCGLRRGELLGLIWEDIDFKNGIVYVRRNTVPTTTEGTITKKPKTRKSRRAFTIPPAVLERLKQIRGVGKIYTKPDGTDYSPGSLSSMFRDFLKRNGLRHIRLHDLRHFNGTMMLKYGVSEKAAQDRLGHTNPQTTRRYQHILKDIDRDAAEKLNEVLIKNKNGTQPSTQTVSEQKKRA